MVIDFDIYNKSALYCDLLFLFYFFCSSAYRPVLNLDIELNVLAIILLLPSLLNKICRPGTITEAPVLFLLKEPPASAKITMQSLAVAVLFSRS